LAVVERADLGDLNTVTVYLHDGPALHGLGELLNREADGLSAAPKSPIRHRSLASGTSITRKDLGWRVISEFFHRSLSSTVVCAL
jgi:hypothetical protein